MRKSVIVVDIDGTTADSSRRLARLEGKPWPTTREGWAHWAEDMEDDPHIMWVIEIVHAMMKHGYRVVFVTAREEYMRSQTTQWIKKVFHPDHFTLWMRENDDRRPAAVSKLELIVTKIGLENVFCALEDDLEVAKAFRKAGINVLHVADPVESPEAKHFAAKETTNVAQ